MSTPAAPPLGETVVRFAKLLLAARHQRAHEAGADPTAYPMLFLLVDGPLRVSEVADLAHADISTVSRQASAFAAAGWVAKVADPADGRAQLLSLTDEGRDYVAHARAERDRWIASLTQDWAPPDRDLFAHQLARLADAVEATLTPRTTPSPEDPR